MKAELFRGAHLKVKWAEQHIRNLNSEIIRFLDFVEKDPYSLSFEEDPKTGNHRLIFKTDCRIPDTFSLTIGDAIHNLRTALDHVAYELPGLFGRTPSKFTKFPFEDSREKLESTVNGGTIKCISPDLKALFLDTIKPYREGGDNALCALHALDIADKHQLLTPVIGVTELRHADLKVGPVTLRDAKFSIMQSGEINIVELSGPTTPRDFTVQNYGQPTFHVLFGKVEMFERQPVIPTLHQLSQLVSRVIDQIAEKCPAPR